jgi:hypothetical protein
MLGARHQTATTYPILGKIVADIRRDERGRCLMSIARFQFWGRYLAEHFPPLEHPKLYQMLGGMTLEFAALKVFASVQLYALATLGLPTSHTSRLTAQSEFLAKEGARHDTLKIQQAKGSIAAPSGPSLSRGVAPPTVTSGTSTLRGEHTRSDHTQVGRPRPSKIERRR